MRGVAGRVYHMDEWGDEGSCRKGVSHGWVERRGAAGRVYHMDGWG